MTKKALPTPWTVKFKIHLNILLLNVSLFRDDAIASLMQAGEAAIEPLCQALNEGSFDRRYYAKKTLIKIGRAAVPHLLEALQHESRHIREFTAEALGEIGDRRAVLPLCKALKDKKWGVSSKAALALRSMRDARAVNDLCELMTEEEDFLRYQASEALTAIGEPSIPALKGLVTHKKQDVRFAVAATLLHLGMPEHLTLVCRAIVEGAWWNRINAAEALGKRTEECVVPALCQALEDSKTNVRVTAAKSLRIAGDERAIQALCMALKDSEYVVLVEAKAALLEMGDLQAILLRTLASAILTPAEKLDTLQILFDSRSHFEGFAFLRSWPSAEEYCRNILEVSADTAVQEGAQTVLLETRNRLDRETLGRAGSYEPPSDELLRAVLKSENKEQPDELMRASQSPDATEHGDA